MKPAPKNGETVTIVPAHARVPVGENAGAVFLPLGGRDVPWSRWWAQRLRDGDISIAAPPAPAPVSIPAPPTPKPTPSLASKDAD